MEILFRTALNKLKLAYNECIKIMFNLDVGRDSMTSIFTELSLPTFNTVIHNSRVLFQNQSTRSTNNVKWFAMLI